VTYPTHVQVTVALQPGQHFSLIRLYERPECQRIHYMIISRIITVYKGTTDKTNQLLVQLRWYTKHHNSNVN